MERAKSDDATLKRLVKIAEITADDHQCRLADLKKARKSAMDALNLLSDDEHAESRFVAAADNPDMQAMGGFQNGAVKKRRSLTSTIETLDDEIASTRYAVREAYAEVQKLEHLIELRRKSRRKETVRNEIAALGDFALRAVR